MQTEQDQATLHKGLAGDTHVKWRPSREELAKALPAMRRSTEDAGGKDAPRQVAVLLARASLPAVNATQPQLLYLC
jgi:hypothetical protein